ncbi:hypothetical protein B0H11DRAFT_1939284 [Mycena galericulata]|nr:hypothetical protein B0H11DRAFT_1939284 [Mycena galericulata]
MFGDCEYPEDGLSRAELLEEQISTAQARIEELEKRKQRGVRSSTSQTSANPRSPLSSPEMGPGPLSFQFSGGTMELTGPNCILKELPLVVLQALVHNFLHNAECFGFFLHTQAFHDAMTSPSGGCGTLPSVLLNVMYLWGVHLSSEERITAYEPAFLANALRSAADGLMGTHPRTVLHSLQASILLAYYFIRNARLLEGKYHTSVAISIAISAGLHHLQAAPYCNSLLLPSVPSIPPTQDSAEGELIAAFWSVLNLNNFWVGIDGDGSNITLGLQISTPWPLDGRDAVKHTPQDRGSADPTSTIDKFLAGVHDVAISSAALRAKAGILFEHATRLAARSPGDLQFDAEVDSLDRRIEAFIATLPRPAVDSKIMMIVHIVAHVSTIRLHHSPGHTFGGNKALSAARSVVGILVATNIPGLGVVDPILAVSLPA